MPEETPAEKPRVKTWRTVKKELDAATAKVCKLEIALEDARAELEVAKTAADAMVSQIRAELGTPKPA